jgi:phosphoserine aminotransferase
MTDKISAKPEARPRIPNFSSGPSAKRPGFSLQQLDTALLGRSHRAAPSIARLQEVISRSRALAGIPDDYKLAIVPASDTGAVELALWSLLGPNPVTVIAWEAFGQDWVTDTVKQLKLNPEVRTAPFGKLPDLENIPPEMDVIFTWNGTTSGVRVPDANWLGENREGLAICDATSAVFAQDIDWQKLDVITWSWQKVLGGEAAHGMLVLSPKAVARLESYTPPWPLPKLFRLTKDGKLNEAIFAGKTINTPSMLAVEDCLYALKWAEEIGGLKAMQARSNESLAIITDWAAKTDWVAFQCTDAGLRSNTGVCLCFAAPEVMGMGEDEQRALVKAMVSLLEKEGVAFDFGAYPKAPPGLRIWCGATVEPCDVKALLPWLDWAYGQLRPSI